MKQIKILHITPHLGGGVGSVLLNWLQYETLNCKEKKHLIATLDFANEKAKEICDNYNIELYEKMHDFQIDLLNLIADADIVIIHFWNHPLLYDFIIKNTFPKCRLLFWSHIAGLHPPYVFPEKILNFSDKFVFTSPISYESNEINNYPNKNKFTTILSTSGIEKFQSLKPIPHNNFNIGYIGTVDYAKMHPDFLQICKNCNIPNSKFIVVGGDKENLLKKEAETLGIANKLEIIGKISNIKPSLSKFDIFAYPLNPNHYGTAEQVLQEAMAAGIVPVVMNNPAEKVLVKHNKTGLISENIEDFNKNLNLLFENPELRNQLSKNCKLYAKKNFSLSTLSMQWKNLFDEILKQPKTLHQYSSKKEWQPHEIFIESLGNYKEPFVVYFEKNIVNDELKKILSKQEWKSDTKGSPKQYLKFLKDKNLERLCKLYE